jgi:hypothetical protein
MIIDVTGTILTPNNFGINCLGNGLHDDIECCCDECDYMRCCMESPPIDICMACDDPYCPFTGKAKSE